MIVHGIPGRYALREGDILSIDFGAVVDGWHGDSAITVPVGAISAEAQPPAGCDPGGAQPGDRGGAWRQPGDGY